MLLESEFFLFTTLHLQPYVHYLPVTLTPPGEPDNLLEQTARSRAFPADEAALVQRARDYAATYNTVHQANLYLEQHTFGSPSRHFDWVKSSHPRSIVYSHS